mmetsp:Transcript_48732/g.150496  ORF Transcript_48732/g.150496 Transcript_48732/m.150496 type:complete len:370 (+) Transcript_48732:295-1404(+)
MSRAQQPAAEGATPREGRRHLAVDDDGLLPVGQEVADEVLVRSKEDIHQAKINDVGQRGAVRVRNMPSHKVISIPDVEEERTILLVQSLCCLKADPFHVLHIPAKTIRYPHGTILIKLLAFKLGNLLLNLRHGGFPPPLEQLILLLLLKCDCLLNGLGQLAQDPQYAPLLLQVHEGLECSIDLAESIACLRVLVLVRMHCQGYLPVRFLQNADLFDVFHRHVQHLKIVLRLEHALDSLVVPILRVQLHLVELPLRVARPQQHNLVPVAHVVALNLVRVQLDVLLLQHEDVVASCLIAHVPVAQDHDLHRVASVLRIKRHDGAVLPVELCVVIALQISNSHLLPVGNLLLEATCRALALRRQSFLRWWQS